MNARIISLILVAVFFIHVPSLHTAEIDHQVAEVEKLCQNLSPDDIARTLKIAPNILYSLMVWNASTPAQEKDERAKKLDEKLHIVAAEYPDLIQQIFTDYVERGAINIKVLESFKKFGAQPHARASTSKHTPLEILETRYGIGPKRTIAGVKCLECDSWGTFFSWLFHVGYNKECTTLRRSIRLLMQEDT